jgi:hypothetical protein
MQGREIDLEKLIAQNELVPAIGNMRVNARGDELGPGGQIVRKREAVVAEYYENNPKAKPVAAKAEVQETAQPVKSKKTQSEE